MKKENGWISVRIDPDERRQLEERAKAEERTMNGMVRLAIRKLLAERAQEEQAA